jgi:hypothetical protein
VGFWLDGAAAYSAEAAPAAKAGSGSSDEAARRDRAASGSSNEAARRDRDDEGVVGRLRALFSAVWDGVFCGECGMSKKCGGIL